jgi:hypothetical protein
LIFIDNRKFYRTKIHQFGIALLEDDHPIQIAKPKRAIDTVLARIPNVYFVMQTSFSVVSVTRAAKRARLILF